VGLGDARRIQGFGFGTKKIKRLVAAREATLGVRHTCVSTDFSSVIHTRKLETPHAIHFRALGQDLVLFRCSNESHMGLARYAWTPASSAFRASTISLDLDMSSFPSAMCAPARPSAWFGVGELVCVAGAGGGGAGEGEGD
jgi:hypothetical protein